jgi:chromosome segregation ATPase
MAKGEKVKTTSPPSSDESEIDSSDESSDEEANQLINDMDKQSRDFMARLIVELEKCQDTLRSERSELETLRLEVDQAESVIATLKEDLAASQAQCNSLKLRNEELEEQYSLLWSSTSHPSEAKVDPSASTSKGCDKCYNIDLESYATNLANMEALKKEIARLNSIIASGCMSEGNKRRRFTKKEKLDKSHKPSFGYIEGARQMEGKLSKKRNVLNSRAHGFCLPRPWRFRARSPEVLESGSLEPHRQ